METREWIRPVVLEGRVVRLEPLEERHVDQLFAATPRDTFRLFTAAPLAWTREEFGAFIGRALADGTRRAFAVVERASGACVGSSSFLDIRPAHRGVEVGYTWYGAAARGTAVNPESKLLLLGHAFEVLGCERVQLKTDGRNTHSQRAIAKMGARFEGVLRRHIVMPDGFVRDTVMFSVVKAEWPEVKRGLEARLGR